MTKQESSKDNPPLGNTSTGSESDYYVEKKLSDGWQFRSIINGKGFFIRNEVLVRLGYIADTSITKTRQPKNSETIVVPIAKEPVYKKSAPINIPGTNPRRNRNFSLTFKRKDIQILRKRHSTTDVNHYL